MKSLSRLKILAASVTAAAVLAACGGGGGGGDDSGAAMPQGNSLPASATASSAGLIAFLAQLMNSDTAEPLLLGEAQLPVDNTAEAAN